MYGQVGDRIEWDTVGRTRQSGEIVFVHQNLADDNIDYYSIATGPDPMDRYFLDSNAMKYLNVINLENV